MALTIDELRPITRAGGMVGSWSSPGWSKLVNDFGMERVVEMTHEIHDEIDQAVSADSVQQRLARARAAQLEAEEDAAADAGRPVPPRAPVAAGVPPKAIAAALAPHPTPAPTPDPLPAPALAAAAPATTEHVPQEPAMSLPKIVVELVRAMKERDASQQAVADALGVSSTSVSNWTSGRSPMSQASQERARMWIDGKPVPAPKLADKPKPPAEAKAVSPPGENSQPLTPSSSPKLLSPAELKDLVGGKLVPETAAPQSLPELLERGDEVVTGLLALRAPAADVVQQLVARLRAISKAAA